MSHCFRCATKQQPCALPRGACKSRHDTGVRAFPSHLLLRCLRALDLPAEYESFLRIELDFCWKMLRVIVESACGIPKKKLGNPDPIAAVVFRGERHHWHALFLLFLLFFFFFTSFICLLWSISWLVISNRQLNLSMSWFLKCANMCKSLSLYAYLHKEMFYQSSVSPGFYAPLPLRLVHFLFVYRWKEEDQSNWQWIESCVEWSMWSIKLNQSEGVL